MSISALAQPQVQPLLQYGRQPFTAQFEQYQQSGQPYGQQFQQPYGQQFQQPFGQQMQGQRPYGPQLSSLLRAAGVQVVSDAVLRVVAACLAMVIEQLRIDPLAQQSLCAQGQLSAQAYSNVLAESARQCAPIVASAFAQITASAHQQVFGQPPYAGEAEWSGLGRQIQQLAAYGQQIQPGMAW